VKQKKHLKSRDVYQEGIEKEKVTKKEKHFIDLLSNF